MHRGIATAITSNFWIADEIAGNFRSEKQMWPFFIAKRIATAIVSLLRKNCILESGQVCGHRLQLFNVGGLTVKPSKIAAHRVNQSQTSTANHRRETVHLATEAHRSAKNISKFKGIQKGDDQNVTLTRSVMSCNLWSTLMRIFKQGSWNLAKGGVGKGGWRVVWGKVGEGCGGRVGVGLASYTSKPRWKKPTNAL